MPQLILSPDELARRLRAGRAALAEPDLPASGAYLVASALRAAVETDPGDARRLTFVVATADVNRNGWQLNPQGWRLDNYLANGVMLWAHDDGSGWRDAGAHGLPFAKAERVWVDGDLLKIACVWAEPGMISGEAGELCESVLRLYRGGYLNAVSAGWIPLEYEFVETESESKIMCIEQELVEVSFVPVPAEPRALRQAAAAGHGQDVDVLRRWASSIIGEPRFVIKPQSWMSADRRAAVSKAFCDFYPGAKVLVLEPGMELAALDASSGLRAIAEQDLAADIPLPTVTAGVVPKNASSDLAPRDASWSAPILADFTEDEWDECEDAERRRIAGYFAWSSEMPPSAFDSLRLPHHEPHSGKVVWKGVQSAMTACLKPGTDIPHGDLQRVYNHLAAHFRAFGEEPPEFHYPGATLDAVAVAAPDGPGDTPPAELPGDQLPVTAAAGTPAASGIDAPEERPFLGSPEWRSRQLLAFGLRAYGETTNA